MKYKSFSGVITMIEEFHSNNPADAGCKQFMSVQNPDGSIVRFVISPHTYFVNHFQMQIGQVVEGFYDADAIVLMIYPPQYQALVVALKNQYYQVEVDHFNEQLISSDGTLKLNISPLTVITLENGQYFTGDPANHDLIVQYDYTTRSIPAQTSPMNIIVRCQTNL